MDKKILLINEDSSHSEMLMNGIESAGYHVQQVVNQLPDISLFSVHNPDVVIFNLNNSISTYVPAFQTIKNFKPTPCVVFVNHATKEEIAAAVKAGVHALIVDGLESSRIVNIIDLALVRFCEQQAYDKELNHVKQSLENRKIIDRAKGVLMDMRGMKEQEAYRSLRKLAMDQNKRMVDVCHDVIEMFKYIA